MNREELAKKAFKVFVGLRGILPSLPAVCLLLWFLWPMIAELLHGNWFFLQDWYDNNTHNLKLLVLFFTNSRVFNALLPYVLVGSICFAMFSYVFYVVVWARVFPVLVKVKDGKEILDRRVYFYTLNNLTFLHDKIYEKLYNKKIERDTVKIWILRKRLFNPFFPKSGMKCLTITKPEYQDRYDSRFLKIRDTGLWVDIDKFNWASSKVILDSYKIENQNIDSHVIVAFEKLATATAEGSKADPHLRKDIMRGNTLVIPGQSKVELVKAREKALAEAAPSG